MGWEGGKGLPLFIAMIVLRRTAAGAEVSLEVVEAERNTMTVRLPS